MCTCTINIPDGTRSLSLNRDVDTYQRKRDVLNWWTSRRRDSNFDWNKHDGDDGYSPGPFKKWEALVSGHYVSQCERLTPIYIPVVSVAKHTYCLVSDTWCSLPTDARYMISILHRATVKHFVGKSLTSASVYNCARRATSALRIHPIYKCTLNLCIHQVPEAQLSTTPTS